MTTFQAQSTVALHDLKELVRRDPAFTAALLATRSTQEAAELAAANHISVTPEALWRHRGTLMAGGMPTWRG
jgi:hypothetical protein